MKRIEINKHQIGLVFKNDSFKTAILEGVHWFFKGETIRVYNKTDSFAQPCHLDILLENKIVADALQIIEVADNELVLMHQNGNFHRILEAGRYAFWKSVVKYSFQAIDLNGIEIDKVTARNIKGRTLLTRFYTLERIAAHEKGLLFVDGKFVRELTPGDYYFWKGVKLVEVEKADLRVQQMEISGQEILTKDKAALRINFFLQYQIIDIQKTVMNTKEATKQLYLLMQMAIREYIGTLTLDELLAKKEAIRGFVVEATAQKIMDLGIQTNACGIRDVILPGEMKDIMNQVLIAEKTAQANTIMRREETAATRSLLNTAKLMEDNTMLVKLKEMEYMEKIADKINSITIGGGGQIVEQLKNLLV